MLQFCTDFLINSKKFNYAVIGLTDWFQIRHTITTEYFDTIGKVTGIIKKIIYIWEIINY